MATLKRKKSSQAITPEKNPFLVESLHPKTAILSIDQSLSSTGMALLIPVQTDEDIQSYAAAFFMALDVKERHLRLAAMSSVKLGKLKAGTFVLARRHRWTSGPRKSKAMMFGLIIKSDDAQFLLLTACIAVEPSTLPERIVAGRSADTILNILGTITHYAALRGITGVKISLEGLAMGGSKATSRILPVLGIVWASMFNAFDIAIAMAPKGLAINLYELPISSWKKAFTGLGRADKKQVETTLINLFSDKDSLSFDTSDESDAAAMALLLARGADCCRLSAGRILPSKADKS
jgi:hypothetical protein